MGLSGKTGLGTTKEVSGLGVVPLDLVGLLPVGQGGEESVVQPQVCGIGCLCPLLDKL